MAGLEEIGGSITDREAFKAGLRQTSGNIPFFVAGAYIVTFLPDLLGIVGMVMAAFAAVMITIFVAGCFYFIARSASWWGLF